MKHQMRIVVSKPNKKPISIAEFKKLTLFERLQSRWFGKVQKLMVIVPQDALESIEIKEVKIGENVATWRR